jgi:magnesium chelatase family protein
MLAKLNTFALVGIDAVPVEVEVDASAGLPKTVLVGLPEMAVKESIHRIERALANLGYDRHPGRTVINLAPADLKKDAGAFDLPIALGLLVATGQILPEQLRDFATTGELALDGSVRPVKGALSMAMAAGVAGVARMLVPAANAREAAVVEAVQVYGVSSLAEAVGILSGQLPAEPVASHIEELFAKLNTYDVDFSDVRGQEFRSPHHTISDAGMVGGGSTPAPGEISLAHHGVLFLDELPEFHRRSLEVLRQPLEEGHVTISRALNSTTFPASFILVAAMNPCPCGYLGDSRHTCKCSPMQIERYMGKISGPLLDRIDLHIEVPSVPFQELAASADGTPSARMREQVLRAREAQRQRFGRDSHRLNGRMTSRQLRRNCALDEEGRGLLKSAMDELGLSARAHDRILRMARTIADLDGSADIRPSHVIEAINYRTLDRKLWAR